jgi:hypothetical protein
LCKSVRQRDQSIEAHTLDLKTGIRRSTARILKHRRDETITAGRKIARHVSLP